MNNLAVIRSFGHSVIVICLAIGLLLQRLRSWPDFSVTTVNLYVVYVALPALVLSEIPHLTLGRHVLLPIIFAWLIMLTVQGLLG